MIYIKTCIIKQNNEPYPLIMPITRHVSERTGNNWPRTCREWLKAGDV